MDLNRKISQEMFQRALKSIPGGVNSPARAFKAVGGGPLFISRGKGSRIWDVDGNEFIDYVCSWGPLILGHCREEVIRAVADATAKGTTFGAPTEIETELAELIRSALPSVDRVRMVNSGTEAVMSALRLARGYTGRKKIVKFVGCYHGHVDALLVKAGSGLATLGTPDSSGVLGEVAGNTFCAKYNDRSSIEDIFARSGEEIAAVIVEPIAGNMGVVLPKEGFLRELRRLCDKHGSLLIFDEVITGFRVAWGGAQTLFGISPDITTLGKIIGGGFPVGAYGGREEIMAHLAPVGGVYQAGTLSGNPVAMHAGCATLKILRDNEVYGTLEKKGKAIEDAVGSISKKLGLPVRINRIGSMFTLFFNANEVTDYASATQSDLGMFTEYFHSMLTNGIYTPPSQYEANFVSAAHTDEDLEKTIAAFEKSFTNLAK